MDFLDRKDEKARLARAFASRTGSFCCLYGRRRCGKSRLLQETLPPKKSVCHVADQMEPTLQRQRLAADLATVLPGFDQVGYPNWAALFERWATEAPAGSCLALDEFPYLVEQSPELPSILQRVIDRRLSRGLHLIVCGSSQRMMQGFVLDASAPLYGRAREILKIAPLPFGWISAAFPKVSSTGALEHYSVWGGVPRYWELAAEYRSLREALSQLVLSPLGVLHSEPRHLLMDDLADVAQASSILALIGNGCNRLSEIAARLEKPATSLTRPLSRLLDLDLVIRETPFGTDARVGKKSLYRLSDPFMGFWFRFVQPYRSLLDTVVLAAIRPRILAGFNHHVASVFECLARAGVPYLKIAGRNWGPAQRWWGSGTDGKPMEIDIVAESTDGRSLLVGEVKSTISKTEIQGLLMTLQKKAAALPFSPGYAGIETVVFAGSCSGLTKNVITPEHLLEVLR